MPGDGGTRGCLQPGELNLPGGQSLPMKMECLEWIKRVKRDFHNDPNVRRPRVGHCPLGYHKIRLWLAADGTFAHMSRQDEGGTLVAKARPKQATVSVQEPERDPQNKTDEDCGALCVPNRGGTTRVR